MALGLSSEASGGDFTPIIKFDSRAGRLFAVNRSQGADGSWNTDTPEITNGFQAIFDLAQIEVGWSRFAAGMAPDFRMALIGQPLPARPGDDYKQGFRLKVKLSKALGGDVRELASNAKAVIGSIDALHTAYLAAPEAAQGKLPIVSLSGTTPITTKGPQGTSTNYAPQWTISGWVDRPAELTGAAPVAPAAAPVVQQTPVAPVVAAPALVSAEEF